MIKELILPENGKSEDNRLEVPGIDRPFERLDQQERKAGLKAAEYIKEKIEGNSKSIARFGLERAKQMAVSGEENEYYEKLHYHGRERKIDKRDGGYEVTNHTQDTLYEALKFAYLEGGFTEHELELLSIAAVYHDLGFWAKDKGNEKQGAFLAEEAMEGYADKDKKKVKEAILATIVGFNPDKSGPYPFQTQDPELFNKEDKISKVLRAADVSNLGRKDFEKRYYDFFQELHGGVSFEDADIKERIADMQRTWRFMVNHLGSQNWEGLEKVSLVRAGQEFRNIQRLEAMISELGDWDMTQEKLYKEHYDEIKTKFGSVK